MRFGQVWCIPWAWPSAVPACGSQHCGPCGTPCLPHHGTRFAPHNPPPTIPVSTTLFTHSAAIFQLYTTCNRSRPLSYIHSIVSQHITTHQILSTHLGIVSSVNLVCPPFAPMFFEITRVFASSRKSFAWAGSGSCFLFADFFPPLFLSFFFFLSSSFFPSSGENPRCRH